MGCSVLAVSTGVARGRILYYQEFFRSLRRAGKVADPGFSPLLGSQVRRSRC